MGTNEAEELISKYTQGKCTAQEKALVESWFLAELEKSKEIEEEPDYEQKQIEIWDRLPKDTSVHVGTRKLWPRMAVAAAAAILILFGAVRYFKPTNQNTSSQPVGSAVNIIQPGGNKATLTLADGHMISLDDAGNGEIARQENTAIIKRADGQLIYTSEEHPTNKPMYNTITTPRSGQYQVILPDGTKVWLNAASSLRYPSFFAENDRLVELTGEAYFEVAKDKTKPFKVIGRNQIVEVLGTHFNVNDYREEPFSYTTLLEGSVRISPSGDSKTSGADSKLLKPGQQSQLSAGEITIRTADTEQAVAWKNGSFMFNDESLESIMRRISRWYDVEVVYLAVDKTQLYGGGVSRYEDVSKVLEKLELTGGVHFKIEGRRIIVMK